MGAYHWRQRRRDRKRFPWIWKTPGEIIQMDLENYEPESNEFALDKKFIDDLQPARDAARARSYRVMFINMMIFAFLVTDYFSLGLNFTIPGVAVIDKKGVREFLIFYSSLSGIYSMVLQNNLYIMDSAVKFIINNKFPIELRGIYNSKYFYYESVPTVSPKSLPHISFATIHTKSAIIFYCFFLFMMLAYFAAYSLTYILISIDVWRTANLGYWSYATAGASITNGIVSGFYLVFTRAKMPYRDYTALHELMGLPQVAPSQLEKRREEIYGESSRDWLDLVNRGYIKQTHD